MLAEQEIKKSFEKLYDRIVNTKTDCIKDFMDKHVDLLKQGRSLIRDVTLLAITILGFVIPILFQSEILNNNKYLFIPFVSFLLTAIYGAMLSLFVIKKDLNNLPKERDAVLKQWNKYLEKIAHVVNSPDEDNARNTLLEINKTNEEQKRVEKSKWWKKILNHEVSFYGLFIISVVSLFLSILLNVK